MKHILLLFVVLGIALSSSANWVSPPATVGDGGTAETWSRYPATTNVNMGNNSLSNFQSIVTANAGARFGMGTTNPAVMFHVNGQARAWSFSASQQGGPTSPTFRFESEPQSGFYKTTNVGELAFATMGLDRFFIGQGTVSLASNVHFDGRGNSITNVGNLSASNLTVRGIYLTGPMAADLNMGGRSITNLSGVSSTDSLSSDDRWQTEMPGSSTYGFGGGPLGTFCTIDGVTGNVGWNYLSFGGSSASNLYTPSMYFPRWPNDPNRTNLVIQYKPFSPQPWGSSEYVWSLYGLTSTSTGLVTNLLFTVTNKYSDCIETPVHTPTLGYALGLGPVCTVTSTVWNLGATSLHALSGFPARPAESPAARFGIAWRYKWVK